jgi:hypothetical protein
MSFFYDLNKKLDSIRATPEVTHQQLNERDMSRAAKGYEKYDNKSVDENRVGPSPITRLPDDEYYQTPNRDAVGSYKGKGPMSPIINPEYKQHVNKVGQAWDKDYEGQKKYIDKTDTNPAYGPKPDETQRLAKRYPAPTKESAGPAAAKLTKPAPAKPSKPAPKGEFMGTIKGGVWTADPPKPGERGVPAPSGDPEGVKEAVGAIDFDKVLDAIAALYGDDIWDNDAMQDLANDLEQANPTDRELDFIIAKGRLPKRLAGIQFSAGDNVQFGESGAPMTAKQKSFAKLAPPANKITFADKIAGAKKEVDEMLGDVAAEAMRSALGGGRGRNSEMDEDNAFDYKTPRSMNKGEKKTSSTGGEIFQKDNKTVVHTAGRNYGGGDEPNPNKVKRTKAGRPENTNKQPERVTANATKHKGGRKVKEGEVDIRDQGEYDQEGDMAKNDIKTIVRHAQALSKVLGDNDNLPEWVQSKLAKIEGMMISVDEYMQNQADDEEEPIAEEPRSKNQAVAARIARGVQKGTAKAKPGSASAKMAKMQPKELNKFAKGSTKGLPKKVSKNKEVDEADENSDDGKLITKKVGPGQSLTTSTTGRVSATLDKGKVNVKPGKPTDDDADTASVSDKDTSTSKSNSMVGKGIYDSMNRELELMIAESMSVNMSDSTEGNKSLTVTATDEDAMKLAMILKSAGLGGGDMHSHGEEACDTCGMQDCGCGDVQEAVDENAPDWPTNTEQADSNFGYSGGLNKPKADVAGNGQSTVPVVATRPHNDDDLRRIKEMAGIQTEDNIDLGPTSPEVAAMSKDEVDAALKSGMSPDISGMTPDEVNAELAIDQEDGTYKDSIQRMREMAGIREAKKAVDEEKTEEGNLFTKGLEDDDVKIGDKIPGTNAIKKKDIDESIFALTNQWQAYKG